ncbi:MAG: hypothetical protein ABIS86_10535 [Streptosporangiaceae bacterium]
MTPTLSITREILRVYDQRFLEVDRPVRRQLVASGKSMLGCLLTETVRQALPEGARLRAFCIENELFDELERLIADDVAGHREGAVVVGGRVYAVYPYLRGVPRQDADITAEVGVEHALTSLAWDRDVLRVRGRAAIDRVQARDTAVELVLGNGKEEHRFAADRTDTGFEALVPMPAPGTWAVQVSVCALGLTRTAPFGAVRDEEFRPPKVRPGVELALAGDLVITPAGTPAPPRRSLSARILGR